VRKSNLSVPEHSSLTRAAGTPLLLGFIAGGGVVVVVCTVFGTVLALDALRSAAAILFSASGAAAAGFRLRGADARYLLRDIAAVLILLALSVVLLVRGAPHNNPAIYWLFDTLGVAGPAAGCLAVLGTGLAAGFFLARTSVVPRLHGIAERRLASAIYVLALLAGLAALAQVLRFWDVPGWGDAIFWDRITHLIARGDLWQGHSYYMPLYQYGTGLLYRTFGHFFWVPQLSNVAAAPLTVLFLCFAACEARLSPLQILLVGALAASHDYLRYTAHILQIENWYIPAVSFALWAALRTLSRDGIGPALLLGLACAIVFGLRTQGAPFAMLLLFVPLFAPWMPWRRRTGRPG
jgi:hypothetical protein